MARSRNIKPGFFVNDDLGSLEPMARLLFVGLWTIADYRGNFEWRPNRIKIQILPYDDCDISKLAINLDRSGSIRMYSNGEKIYGHIVNFTKHQNPHKNERDKGSDVPQYKNDDSSMRQVIDFTTLTINRDKSGSIREHSASDPADSLILKPDPGTLKPETLIPKSTEVASAPVGDEAEKLFDLFWQAGMSKANKKGAQKAFVRIVKQKANKTEFTQMLVDDIKSRLGAQMGFDTLHPMTYLNNERWNDEAPKALIPIARVSSRGINPQSGLSDAGHQQALAAQEAIANYNRKHNIQTGYQDIDGDAL